MVLLTSRSECKPGARQHLAQKTELTWLIPQVSAPCFIISIPDALIRTLRYKYGVFLQVEDAVKCSEHRDLSLIPVLETETVFKSWVCGSCNHSTG